MVCHIQTLSVQPTAKQRIATTDAVLTKQPTETCNVQAPRLCVLSYVAVLAGASHEPLAEGQRAPSEEDQKEV